MENELLFQLGINWKLFLSQVVNFFILLLVLTFFVYKPLIRIIKERSKKIKEGLEKAEEADVRLKEIDIIGAGKIREAEQKGIEIIKATEVKAKILDKEGIDFVLDIYGAAAAKDNYYFEELKKTSVVLQDKGKLFFRGAVPNTQTPLIFNAHLVSVNLTPKGNYDKTVLEGMACGTLPLVSSSAFNDIIPAEFRFKEDDNRDLVEKIKFIFSLSETAVAKYGSNCRRAVEKNHALNNLVNKILKLCFQS